MGELAVFIKTRAKSGKRGELQALYQEMLAPRALENSDQEVVVWCADQHDPDMFYLFEIYTNSAAMGATSQAEWFGDYMAKAGPLLADEPEVGMATPLWSKGV